MTNYSMTKKYKILAKKMLEINALAQAAGLAGWDQETMMPEKAIVSRSEQIAALSSVIHEKFVDPKIGKTLRELARSSSKLSENERVSVREWKRDYERSVRLPTKFVEKLARVEALSQNAWIKARKISSFKAFAPWLKELVALKREQAEFLGYKDSPYDALLDSFEPYMSSKELTPIFEELKKGLVPLVHKIAASKKKTGRNILTRKFPKEKQEELCKETMSLLGLDMKACRLDVSAHPFCAGIAPRDVRITTRYNENWLPGSFYGVMHECGHALYDMGLPEKFEGTPLCEAVSVGVHESQSRFWENIVGRSYPFIKFILPVLKKKFPASLKNVSARDFYEAVNCVRPSLIRVEADEVTYNLHIILRFELEKALIEKKIEVGELPVLWNKLMKKYFGLTPPDDAHGVLQDTHWAGGMFGYFPTYSIGNILAAQIWKKMGRDIPNISAKIEKGNFAPLLDWQRKHIHRHGRRFKSVELIKRATGEALTARYFLDYLWEKFGEIYNLR